MSQNGGYLVREDDSGTGNVDGLERENSIRRCTCAKHTNSEIEGKDNSRILSG